MSKSSSEINDEEKGEEENIEIVGNTEENVINNKNRTFYFSMNLSKYKKYTLNNNINNINNINGINSINNNGKIISENKIGKSKTNKEKSINLETIDNEHVNEEKIKDKIKIYKCNSNKNILNEECNNINIINQKSMNESQISSEQLFLRQKERIKLMKEKNYFKLNNSLLNKNQNNKKDKIKDNHKKSDSTLHKVNSIINDNYFNDKNGRNINHRISFKETCLYLTLDDPQFFEISHLPKNFNININEDEDEEEEDETEIIPIFNNDWKNVKHFKKINNCIEFSNMALRTLNEVNYSTNGVEINIDLSLIGYGEFWIFSRCFVNKDINDSEIFDTCSINNESDVIFNKYTSLIKIIKEKNSSKCFVTFGTFYEDETDENKIKYETFLKRQLVDFSHTESVNVNNSNSLYYYLENDLIDIRIIITDLGIDTIDTKIFINKNQKFNHIEGKFYLPTNKRSKILFCGIGPSVPVRKLRINNIEKFEDENNEFTRRSCTCCNIY